MPRRKRLYKTIDEAGFKLTDALRKHVADKYPDVDIEATYELFYDNCLSHGREYANWEATFRNWLRSPPEWGGVAYKPGLDPTWRPLIDEANAIGFRKPHAPIESRAQYRQALRAYQPPKQQSLGGIELGNVIKRFGRD